MFLKSNKLPLLVCLLLVAVLLAVGCSRSPVTTSANNSSAATVVQPAAPGTLPCEMVYPLTAGQTIPVGTMTVWNDSNNLYVHYTITDTCWTFGTLHLWVGTDTTNVPAAAGGNPIPGQFPFSFDATGSTDYTFTIPFGSISAPDVVFQCGLKLYVFAHAEVANTCNSTTETAWGGDVFRAPGRGKWYYYGTYSICCDFPPPPAEFICKTAFAKGGWVFVTGSKKYPSKSNPENLPSLNLTVNRWGWAINLPGNASGTYTYDIWAGAGLNNTANGTKVGTLTVSVVGTEVTVTYQLFGFNVMSEVHIYASTYKPTTVAPGQYGHTAYFDPHANSYTYTFDVGDDVNGDGTWIIAHAVACIPVVAASSVE